VEYKEVGSKIKTMWIWLWWCWR